MGPVTGVVSMSDGTVKWQPATHRLDPRHTPADDVYLIGHFGVATVDPTAWRLQIDGLVDRPIELGLDDLRAAATDPITSLLECYGNPLDPDVPVRRAANLRWRGVPVRALLERTGIRAGATTVWATGLDHGTFAGTTCTEYRKDLPLDVVVERGIVAVEFDGGPLPVERGFPARLVVPGYLGTNNVKWLGALTVADHRPEHLFTTRLYMRGSAPVREMDVNSLITTPADGAPVTGDVGVAGWAWGFDPVERVEVAVDGRWETASVEPRAPGAVTWQRFSTRCTLAPGSRDLAVRATDRSGRTQPDAGARNAVHHVTVHGRKSVVAAARTA